MADFTSLLQGLSRRDIGYIIKGIIQKSINTELTNAEISSSDNKTPVLITNSKDVTLMNDLPIQASIEVVEGSRFYMTEEADGKDLRIWAKFNNAGKVRDHSLKKVPIYSVGNTNMPGLFHRYNDNNQIKYELFSYFNGINQFAYAIDNPEIRILANITANKKTSIFMRMLPISLARVLNTQFNSLFSKIDDDQLRYGYGATVDMKGNIHFYVRNNYRQYHLMVKDAYAHILTDPAYNIGSNFRYENFSKKDFMTNYQALCNIVASTIPFDDWIFTYDPITHRLHVIKTSSLSASAVAADTNTITPKPLVELPIQDGRFTHSGTTQTTVYDASGNNHNGTITNYTVGGQWEQDNTFTCLGEGNGAFISLPSIAAANTLTEFTVAFWYNSLDELIPSVSKNLVRKGLSVAQSFNIYRDASTNNVKFSVYDTGSGDDQTVTFPNAFPMANQWYLIVAKWKSGEKAKLSINNTAYLESDNIKTYTLTNSTDNIQLFGTTTGPKGKIALFRFYNTQITQQTHDDLYYEGYHNPLFPRSETVQVVWDDTPDPITIPFSNIYLIDKMTSPVAADYAKINSLSGSSPFTLLYNVADAVSTTDPVSIPYNVPIGVNTGGGETPFSEQYNLPIPGGNNSSVRLSEPEDNISAAIEVQAGSSLIGKKITKATFYLKGVNSPTGNIMCRIWDPNDNIIATLGYNGTANAGLNAVNVNTSNHTAYSFWNVTSTYGNLAAGWRVGLEYYTGTGDDEIQVRRDSDAPRSNEVQASEGYDGTWNINSSYDVCGILYTGGTGSPVVTPWITINASSQYIIGERFGSTSGLNNKAPTKVELRVKKKTGTTGTLYLQIVNSSGAWKSTLATWNIATELGDIDPPTGTFNLVWNNTSNTSIIGTNEHLTLTAATTLSSGGEVYVMSNKGNNAGSNNHTGSTSYIRKRNSTGTWSDYDTSLDISGKISIGGNSFTAYKRFSNTVIRITTKVVNTQSTLHNKKITRLIPRIKKVGSPTGIITATIRDPNDVIKVQFSSVDLSTIPSNGLYNNVEFTNVVHNYYTNSGPVDGDKICYEYSGSDATSNYLELNANKDVIDPTTLATITQHYNGNYVDDAQHDLAGKLYSGGEPDLTSRTRVAQSIEHQNSRLKGKKITRVKVYLYRTNTSTTGNVYCNIRRGSDDALIKTIDAPKPLTFSTNPAIPTEVTFTDTTNTYSMGVGDKISIEYNGGSSTNQLGVLIRTVVPDYDTVNNINCSLIRKYDEIDYDDILTTKDLCGTMEEGGFLYTPAAGEQPDPTPVNDKDLIILAGNNKLSGFVECLLKEFRIYTKELTLTHAASLHNNRYTISPIEPGQILMPFTLRMVPDEDV